VALVVWRKSKPMEQKLEPKDKIVALHGISHIPTNEPVEEVVKYCRDLLEKAERGEVTALIVAFMTPANVADTSCALGTRGTHTGILLSTLLHHWVLEKFT